MDPMQQNQRVESVRASEVQPTAGQFNVPALLEAGKGMQPAREVPQGFPNAGRLLQRLDGTPNPAGELAATLQKMDNLRSASVTRLPDGRHQIGMHFDHATQMPAINANIRGFRPGPTSVGQDISFTLSHTQNGVQLDNMRGFTGCVTGPLGRTRPTWNNGLHIGRDQAGNPFVDVDSTMQGPFRMRRTINRFGEQNFDANSPMRQLMHNPDVLSEASNALRLFQSKDDVQHATLSKTRTGSLDLTAESKAPRDIALNQKIEKIGATMKSIHLDSSISGTLSYDQEAVKFGNVKGMSVKVQSLLGETTVTPKSFALQNNKEGVPIVKLEVELNGTTLPVEVPVATLRERSKR